MELHPVLLHEWQKHLDYFLLLLQVYYLQANTDTCHPPTSELDVEQPGFELMPLWDPSVADSGLIGYNTAPAPSMNL